MREILLIQLKRIGDVILTTPVVAPIRQQYPDAKITMAVDGNAAGLADALPVDRVLVRGSGVAAAKFWSRIAAGGFGTAIDFSGTDRACLACTLSRAALRVGYARFAKRPLRRVAYNALVDSSVRDRHTVDHHLDLLAPLDIQSPPTPPDIRLPEAVVARADAQLSAIQLPPEFVVIHAGSARSEKFWTAGAWAHVAAALHSKPGLPILFTGSASHTEQGHIAAIRGLLGFRTWDVSGTGSLLETAAMLSRARVVLTVDSAPVHLCEALGVPVVALFGPTNPFHWRPRGTASRVIEPPGAPSDSPKRPILSMDAIAPEDVIKAATKLLALTRR